MLRSGWLGAACWLLQSYDYKGLVVSLGYVDDEKLARMLSSFIGGKIMGTLVVSEPVSTSLSAWGGYWRRKKAALDGACAALVSVQGPQDAAAVRGPVPAGHLLARDHDALDHPRQTRAEEVRPPSLPLLP